MSFIEKYNSLKSAAAKAETEAKEATIAEADSNSEVIRLKADKAAGENVTAAKINKAVEKRAKAQAEAFDLQGVAENLKARLADMATGASEEVGDIRATFCSEAQAAMTDRSERVAKALSGESPEPIAKLVCEMRVLEQLCGRYSIPLSGGLTGGQPGQSTATANQFIFMVGEVPMVIDDAMPKIQPDYSESLLEAIGTESLKRFFDLARSLSDLAAIDRQAA